MMELGTGDCESHLCMVAAYPCMVAAHPSAAPKHTSLLLTLTQPVGLLPGSQANT